MLSGSYTEEQSRITAGIPQKESEIQCLRETVSGTDSFLDKAKRYTDITELTPELLRLFIEKIVVHEKEVKWSKHAPQTVEIYYNGIGYVGSGQQDVEEALEAPESLQTQDTEEAPAGSEHRSMYSYVRLSIDRCTATYSDIIDVQLRTSEIDDVHSSTITSP